MLKKTKEGYLSETALPAMLHFELTGKCNLKCKQCYNDSGNRETVMTAEHWKQFAKKSADSLFSVTLSGGEPLLLGQQLFDIMDIFEEGNTWINMISNGFLIDREIAKQISQHSIGWVEISIDSPYEEYHDYLRGVPGSWRRAVLAASYLASYNVPVIIGTCVTPKVLNQMEEMVKLAQQIGVMGLTFTKVLVSGRAYYNQQELVLNDEQTESFITKADRLQKNTKDIKINYTTQSVQDAVNDDTHTSNYQIPIIRPDGKMRLSCFEPIIIGDVINEDITTLWERYKKVRSLAQGKQLEIADIGINYVDKEVNYNELLQSC